MEDPRLLFDKARSALGAGDSRAAADFAARLLAMAPNQPQALHLMAVAERRNGRLDAARGLFESALVADPGNPEIHNNFANLLDEMQALGKARDHYRLAIERAPDYADAQINLAVVCRRMGAVGEGLKAARRGAELAPRNPRAWTILGQLREEAGDAAGATAALERALEIAPRNARALSAAALLELHRGGAATARFERALTVSPGDPDLALGSAAARHAAGDTPGAKAALEALLAAAPEWIAAHSMLTKLHVASGEVERACESFQHALAHRPQDQVLWTAYLQTCFKLADYHGLSRVSADARRALGEHPLVLGFAAVAADELGEHDRAASMLASLDSAAQSGDQPDGFAVALTRNLLRTGHTAEAAARARAATGRGVRALWPYLATAWRILGDRRWEELEGDPCLIAAVDLPQAGALLGDLIPVLRRLHTDHAPPLGQTLKGGSQTEGALFLRREPEIAALAGLLMEGVKTYVAQLPAAQEGHPLLAGGRDGLRYSGSWSVRLGGGGFHVNHVHPAGWISSAFYVVLPPPAPDADAHAGWLTLGEPPAELGLKLPPFRTIEPRPGRLALFPAYTWHGTRAFGAGERLTVAFDTVRELA